MRRHTRRIPKGYAGRSRTALAGFTLVTGGLAFGGPPARAQVTVTFGTGWALIARVEDTQPAGPTPPSSSASVVAADVILPNINPAWVSSSSPGVVTNSLISWMADFHADFDGSGSGTASYSGNLGSGTVTSGSSPLPTPPPNPGQTEVTWFNQGTSTATPPLVGNLYKQPVSASVSALSFSTSATVTTQGSFLGLLTMTHTFTPSATWTGTGSGGGGGGGGGWVGGGGWGGKPIPNGRCTFAYFGSGAVDHTISLDAPVTVGGVVFDDPSTPYTINGPYALTLDCANGLLHVERGSHTVNADVHYAASTTVSVARAQDTLTTAGAMSAGTGVALGKIGDGTWATRHVRAPGLTVSQGVVRAIADPGADGTSAVESLAVNDGNGAALDLARNHLVVDYASGSSPFAEVRRLVTVGYHGGDWLGAGLTSSDAAASVGTSAVAGLGYAESAALGLSAFGGQGVDATAVLVRYTLLGDANLDGTVDSADQALLTANLNAAGTWAQGDFDYDGTVTAADQALLDANYGQSLPAAGPAAPVPEPASLAAAGVGLAALGLRRGRRGIAVR